MTDNFARFGDQALDRLMALARLSEPGPGVTRIFASDEHKHAVQLIGAWMAQAGMSWRIDHVGNVVGRYPASGAGTKLLILGSHQDTVREGGAFDGAVGIVLPILCVQRLHDQGIKLPFAIEIVGFSDEEGVRYGTTLLGSKALAGTFEMAVLDQRDRDGISMRDALRRFGCEPDLIPKIARHGQDIIGFIETHIEQGPVLERMDLPVGLVTGIVHGLRQMFVVDGVAGHAGTVPMAERSDALCAACEAVLAVERLAAERSSAMVGTVGTLSVGPGAINVIPGRAEFTADLRAPSRLELDQLADDVQSVIQGICAARGVGLTVKHLYRGAGCAMSDQLMAILEASIAHHGTVPLRLISGAGHDAMAMKNVCDIAMLFVRCAGGISHNPAESVVPEDLGVAGCVLLETLHRLAARGSGDALRVDR